MKLTCFNRLSRIQTRKGLSYWSFFIVFCLVFSNHYAYAGGNGSPPLVTVEDSISPETKWPIMMNLLNRIRGEYSASFQNYTMDASQIALTLLGNKSSSYSTSVNNYFGTSLSVSYGFYLSKHLYLMYGINSRFGTKILNKNNQIALGYNGVIEGAGRNYYIEPYFAYYFGKNGYGMGSYTGAKGESFGRVPLRPNKSLLYVGTKQQGLALGIGFRVDVGSFMSMMLGATHYFPLSTKHGVFNANKAILYTRTGFQEFNQEMNYQEDSESLNQSSFSLDPWQFKIGFMFAL